MNIRSQLEKNEKMVLTSYAATSADSRGRMYPEDEHNYRTAFQRDRDRIIHTSAFRRLEYKTQVFVNHEGDYYRTRLTHTLEVAQIGRTIARALGVNETLTEAICLAHDLGHTPFGHSGQDIMNELMKDHGGFEHNKQSFRIVTYLERPYPDFTGLNLTYEVLEGITKHASEYDMPDGSVYIKSGYPSIEAQIANYADEIAYNNHDIDDGIQSGLLNLKDLESITIWKHNHDTLIRSHNNLNSKQLRRQMTNLILTTFITDLIQNTTKQIQERQIKTIADVSIHGKKLVSFSDTVHQMNIELKKYLLNNLYRHKHVEHMRKHTNQVVIDLFTIYHKDPKLIPPEFTEIYSENEPIERIICDYIAGMTDRYASEEHKKLLGN